MGNKTPTSSGGEGDLIQRILTCKNKHLEKQNIETRKK